MKRLIVLVAVAFLTTGAFADDEFEGLEKRAAENGGRNQAADTSKYEAERERVKAELDAIDKDLKKEQEAVTAAETALREYQASIGFRPGFQNTVTKEAGNKLGYLEDKIADAKKKRDEMERKFNMASAKLAEAKEDLDAVTARANPTTVKEQMDLLKKQIKQINLTDNFQNLQGKKLELNDRLEAVERGLDQTMLGTYVREKLARFMASKAFCEAYEACEESDPHKPISFDKATEYLDDAFHNAEGTLGRTRKGTPSEKKAGNTENH